MRSPVSTMRLLNSMSGPDLAIHPERCVLVRNRNADCLRCAEACTSGAISADEDGLTVDPDKCIGCGTCASVCPTCALEATAPDDQALARAGAAICRDTGGTVTFACSQAVADAAATSVPGCAEVACLGRIDATELVELAVRGATRVVLAHGDCSSCPHANGRTVAEYDVQTALDLLAMFGCDMAIEFADASALKETVSTSSVTEAGGGAPARSFTLKRLARLEATPQEVLDAASDIVAEREGFEDGRYCDPAPHDEEAPDNADDAGMCTTDPAADSAADADAADDGARLPRVGKDGALPQFVPTRRTRLFNCLKALGEPPRETFETGLWGTVTIDADRCESCRMCAVFCPTGALRRTREDEPRFGITHQPTFCVQCGTCEAICRNDALRVSPAVDLADFLHGKKTLLEMERPAWEPNKPDSIFQKMVGVLGSKNNLAYY